MRFACTIGLGPSPGSYDRPRECLLRSLRLNKTARKPSFWVCTRWCRTSPHTSTKAPPVAPALRRCIGLVKWLFAGVCTAVMTWAGRVLQAAESVTPKP